MTTKSISSIAWVGVKYFGLMFIAVLFRFSNIFPVLIGNYQEHSSTISGMSFGSIAQGEENRTPMNSGLTYDFQQDIGFPSWGNVAGSASYQSLDFQLSLPSTQSNAMSMMPGQDSELLDQVFTGEFKKQQEFANHSDSIRDWQVSYVRNNTMHVLLATLTTTSRSI